MSMQRSKSAHQPQHHEDFHLVNGSTSSGGNQSTLTQSTAASTTLRLSKKMLDASADMRLVLEQQIQCKRSKPWATGLLHGEQPAKQPCLSSHTEDMNLRSGGEHIEDTFTAWITGSHSRVIAYDRAVRDRVQGGQAILLNDWHRLQPIRDTYLLPDGADSRQ
jgi:hypothetical protein